MYLILRTVSAEDGEDGQKFELYTLSLRCAVRVFATLLLS